MLPWVSVIVDLSGRKDRIHQTIASSDRKKVVLSFCRFVIFAPQRFFLVLLYIYIKRVNILIKENPHTLKTTKRQNDKTTFSGGVNFVAMKRRSNPGERIEGLQLCATIRQSRVFPAGAQELLTYPKW